MHICTLDVEKFLAVFIYLFFNLPRSINQCPSHTPCEFQSHPKNGLKAWLPSTAASIFSLLPDLVQPAPKYISFVLGNHTFNSFIG